MVARRSGADQEMPPLSQIEQGVGRLRANDNAASKMGPERFAMTDFSRGRLSRSMRGRSDLPWYQTGLEECKNMLVRKQGSLFRRPGMRTTGMLDTLWTRENEDALEKPVLQSFVFSEDESYVVALFRRFAAFVQNSSTDRYEPASDFIQLPEMTITDVERVGSTSDVEVTVSGNHSLRHQQDVFIDSVTTSTASIADAVNGEWFTVDLTTAAADRVNVTSLCNIDEIGEAGVVLSGTMSTLQNGDRVYFEASSGGPNAYAETDKRVNFFCGPQWKVRNVYTNGGVTQFTLEGVEIEQGFASASTPSPTLVCQRVVTTKFRIAPSNAASWVGEYASGGKANGRLEIGTPFSHHLKPDNTQFTQSADILMMVNRTHPPCEIRRTSLSTFEFGTSPIRPKCRAPRSITLSVSGPNSGTAYEYRYRVIAINSDGISSLATEATISTTNVVGAATNEEITIAITSDARTSSAVLTSNAPDHDKYECYRYVGSAAETWRLVKTVSAPATPGTVNAVDDGSTGAGSGLGADGIFRIPRKGDADEFVKADRHPGSIAQAWQRLWLGGTNQDPTKVWASKVGDYADFSASDENLPDEPIEFTPATERENEILFLVNLQELISLTRGQQTRIYATQADFSAPVPGGTAAQPQRFDSVGRVTPIKIDDTLLYLTGGSNAIKEMRYRADGLAGAAYGGRDVSVLSDDLFEGRELVRWAYESEPSGVIWMVMDDGKAVACTYAREHELVAFSEIETVSYDSKYGPSAVGTIKSGKIRQVASIPEKGGDGVYFAVERLTNKSKGGAYTFTDAWFVDRLEPDRVDDDPDTCRNLDAGYLFESPPLSIATSGVTSTAPAASSTLPSPEPDLGLGYQDVVVEFNAGHGIVSGDLIDIRNAVGPYTNANGRWQLVTGPTANKFRVKDAATGYNPRLASFGSGDDPKLGDWRIAKKEFLIPASDRRLEPLVGFLNTDPGYDLSSIANGSIPATCSVTWDSASKSFKLTVSDSSSRVFVGFSFESEVKTMPLASREAPQVIRKSPGRVTLRLMRSRDFSISVPGGTKSSPRTRPSDPNLGFYIPTPLFTGDVEVVLDSLWTRRGQLVVTADGPFPLEIQGLFVDTLIGGN